ncbi:mucin-5AC-like [Anopheles albimanus]|uniref:Uncharacterized protein n=1 Tax=Anopheles albimanus TaxID=7167 RepID=A0A182FQQ3_ANOAL|nr:mucin-5AC-like [Anopheles albimanus]XP_035773469.1 mucin-5AC-like [Anopheles albimanus]XP_035773470.1 mucin-5AC-like [Anopheles albimanus]XP_035773471.1 mucin-5AC-like [Anopheles albimanus]
MRWVGGGLASLLPVLLLLFATLLDGETVQGSPYPRPFPQTLRRLPRRNDYIAYNLHRTIRPRDVNELGVNQARKAMHDVHETIAEVQRLLALDPSLPRLTRGEIEELFENVTREEFAKSIRAGDHNRAQHMRALMLVLPYHAHNMSPENLQQIYTRPPVTRIVGAADSSNQRPIALPVVGTTVTTSTTTTPSPPPPPVRTTMADLPVTTIRFTTPRPTTFHPTLPERMRDPGARLRPEELNEILSAIGLSQSPPSFRPMPTTTTTTTTTTEQPTTTTPAPDTPISNSINVDDPKVAQELKQLLRSFGLLQEEGGPSFGSPTAPAGIESLASIQPSALVLHEPLRVEESLPTIDEPSATTTTTTTTIPVVEEKTPVTGGLTQAKVNPDDYIAFKPLPISILGEDSAEDTQKTRDAELDQLLQSFGLLSPGRSKKSMHRPEQQQQQQPVTALPTMTAMPAIDADLVAPQLMSVLGTLGIQMRNGGTVNQAAATASAPSYRHSVSRREKSGRKLDPPTSAAMSIGDASRKPAASSSTPTSSALFRVNNEDYNKLQQLWQAVKELEKLNVNLTDESLDVLNPKHYDLSPSLLAQGPDPLDGVEAQERLNEIKKRQQPGTATTADDATVPVSDSPTRFNLEFDTGANENDTPSSSSAASPTTAAESDRDATESSTTTTVTTSTTTTESARNAALLEESFPSADLAGDPVNEEPLPPPRRTGFYFLYDWNTFLEVGEEPNKVIIRYNPKAGDPSRFLPVNVP